MLLSGRTREKLTDAAERISSNVASILGIALLAVVLAAGALVVSLRCLNTVRG